MVQPSSPIDWIWDHTPYPWTCAGNANPAVNGDISGWTDYSVSALAAIDSTLPQVLPDALWGAQQPCPSASATGTLENGLTGTAWTLWGGDMATTPAYLVSVDYPGFCLGIIASDGNQTAHAARRVGLVNCTAPISGERKPLALLHDLSNGRLWWNAPAQYLCLQALNATTGGGLGLDMWECQGDSPAGITSWGAVQLGNGAVAFHASDATGACVGVASAPAPAPFVYLSMRLSRFPGGALLLPLGYNLVVYQAPSPTQPGGWALSYGQTTLALGLAPTAVVPGAWHRLQLSAVGKNVSAYLDGTLLTSVEDGSSDAGMVALGSSWHGNWFDAVNITVAM